MAKGHTAARFGYGLRPYAFAKAAMFSSRLTACLRAYAAFLFRLERCIKC